MSTQIEFTDRMNLGESAAIKILQKYCPNTTLDEILSWRKGLRVIPLLESSRYKIEDLTGIDVHYWIKNDKARHVIISVNIDHNGQRWFLENLHFVWVERPGRNRTLITLSFLESGELVEINRRHTDNDPFDGC